ncbi:MAG: tRNA glutamyl-Q(34) synthetase GluQRS [Methylococcaceae bacterium]
MSAARYTSRFAPSPTGHLHLGSVYTALASFLDARVNHGLWQIRFDDLDTPRNVKGASDNILKTLEILGLHWDNAVDFQSQHLEKYEAVLADLIAKNHVYRCECSRKDLPSIYPQTCRNKNLSSEIPYSLRLKTDSSEIFFDDVLQGRISRNLAEDGDFILKRKDSIIAYQFAVVLDDMRQNVNHIVRGIDLLNETPKQIFLQQILNLPMPNYCHIPVLADSDGKKLSKTTFAAAVNLSKPNQVLFKLLTLLKQNPPVELEQASVAEILMWAIENWHLENLKGISILYI